MSIKQKFFSILFTILAAHSFQPLHAQDNLSWLDDYTGDMQIGSETYQYNFTNVEGNDCKLKFEEVVTNKKGAAEARSWIFYLSDIDPSAISFKAKGKSIGISMETHQSQKFITYYEEGELDGYTEEIAIKMNEVDMTRSFIEAIKENITHCKETQATWEDRGQALTWLVKNVDNATDDKIKWEQKFEQGSRDYIIEFQANSVNEKGEQEMFSYTLDLNDINPSAINLKISGKSLIVELPVKENKKFIKAKSGAGTEFINELLIYANEIELARQIVNALSYLVNNTTPEREQWDSYTASLEFVKDNLGEVKIGDELYSNRFSFDTSPSGLVDLVIERSDSDGTSESVTNSFYLTDIMDKLELDVSKSSITIEMETKNRLKYISEIADDKVRGYSSTLGFHVADIDMARDILNAFEHAIRNSEEDISEFNNISEVSSWFSEHIGTIETDGDKYEQTLSINEENENQLNLIKKLTEADEGTTESSFILYPEDLSLDDLEIKVSGKKLTVPLETDKGKYIKKFENGKLQNFTGNTDVMFLDPLVAKNFIAAIRFLKANSVVEERAAISKNEALSFLSGNIQSIDLPDDQYEQKLEFKDEGNCKMSFTRVETDNKGASDEHTYEFNISDIHPGSSKLSVKGEIISINLVTSENEKLIKPYKNGETGDFVDDFVIYVDDILLAKKTLAAFAALSEGCN
ncbi:MAG: hypothetical protein ABFS38_13930 [Bacteroidota bacterium]